MSKPNVNRHPIFNNCRAGVDGGDLTGLGPKLMRALSEDDEPGGGRILKQIGLHDTASAWRHLIWLTEAIETGPLREKFVASLLGALPRCADIDLALVNFRRYVESRYGDEAAGRVTALDPPLIGLLVELFGFSQFLADLMIRYPQYLEWLQEDEALSQGRTTEQYGRAFGAAIGAFKGRRNRRNSAIRALRRELLRLGVRRMLAVSDEAEMTRELSDLASASLDLAIDEIYPDLVTRFGEPFEEMGGEQTQAAPKATFMVIAMGKLGGRELNFSSDIDLLFIYSEEGKTTGREEGLGNISNHMFFTRLAEGVIQYLSEASDEGNFYRVDTRLRPDGDSGPLVRSFSAYEIYYETQAYPWERMALLKARWVAGARKLGLAFEAMSRPLVFDPLHSNEIIAQIHDLKMRIDHEIAMHEGADREVKRGEGGIRELEFLVQTLQMLHGARDSQLAVGNMLEALGALERGGLLAEKREKQMREDYLFLRTIEHRLQMMQMLQTHMMPEEPLALDALARRCGLSAQGAQSPGEVLMQRWGEVSGRIHHDFLEFFAPEDADEAGAPGNPCERLAELILSAAPEASILPEMAPMGLAEVGVLKALRRMGGMGRSSYLSAEGRSYYRDLLPILLEVSGRIPRPETALVNLESFLAASGATTSFYAIFLQNPNVIRLLILAFGSGNYLAQAMIAHPEFMDHLANPATLSASVDPQAKRERLDRWTMKARDEKAFCAGLARFKRFEFLMAGLGEVAGLLEYEMSCRRTSLTAEMILRRCLSHGAEAIGMEACPRHFAVLAMGKLGNGELNYHSDLDLIFVWEEGFGDGGPASAQTAAELGERVVSMLTATTVEGKLFDIDVRLRPEGQNAPLTPTLGRYLDYYGDRAQIWEFQSALKMRPVAGDQELAERLIDGVRERIIQRCEGLDTAAEIRSMRRRMEASHKIPRWVFCDFKTGRGGSVDLEFIAQYLQLSHLAEDSALMGMGPLGVFPHMAEAGWLDPALAQQLLADYIWLRRLERRTRLLFESERTYLPSSGEKLEALEAACRPLLEGLPGNLQETVNDIQLRNRKHFNMILQETTQP